MLQEDHCNVLKVNDQNQSEKNDGRCNLKEEEDDDDEETAAPPQVQQDQGQAQLDMTDTTHKPNHQEVQEWQMRQSQYQKEIVQHEIAMQMWKHRQHHHHHHEQLQLFLRGQYNPAIAQHQQHFHWTNGIAGIPVPPQQQQPVHLIPQHQMVTGIPMPMAMPMPSTSWSGMMAPPCAVTAAVAGTSLKFPPLHHTQPPPYAGKSLSSMTHLLLNNTARMSGTGNENNQKHPNQQQQNANRPSPSPHKPIAKISVVPEERLLCAPLESPSPFAQQDRQLLTIKLIRNAETEPSYGVSLNMYKMSALVDAQWIRSRDQERQRRKKEQEKPSCSATSPDATTTTDADPTAPEDTKLIAKGEATSIAATASTSTATPEGRSSHQTHENPAEIQSDGDRSATDSIRPDGQNGNPSSLTTIRMTDAADTKAPSPTPNPDVMQSKVAPRQQRRRRVDFLVMYVTDATKQNSRRPEATQEELLQTGDIVISVGGCNIADMTFQDACSLVAKKSSKVDGDSHNTIEVEIVVARKRAIPPPQKPIQSSTISGIRAENTSMNFLNVEIAFLVDSFRQAMEDPNRVLGENMDPFILHRHADIFRVTSLSPRHTLPVSHRGVSTLMTKWSQMGRSTDFLLVQRANEFWSKIFAAEYSEEEVQNLPFRTEAQCVALRNLPRPLKGCRCSRQDHEYVFDAKCPLYRNVRNRLSPEELGTILSRPSIDKKPKTSSSSASNLGTVGSAYLNRIVKLKHTTENEEAEARFVDAMEQMEAKELKKAVFAPKFLSSIILSSIFELQREFSAGSVPPVSKFIKAKNVTKVKDEKKQLTGDYEEDEDEEDDDDDDDVPLALLSKRGNPDQKQKPNKRAKTEHEWRPMVSMHYLARMLDYISKTWGHCFREMSHRDYAWRWEVFHGAFSQSNSTISKNPRQPNSLPFENVRFGTVELLTAMPKEKEFMQELANIPASLNSHKSALLSHLRNSYSPPSTSPPSSVGPSQHQAVQTQGSGTVPKSDDISSSEAPKLVLREEPLKKYSTIIHLISTPRTGLYDELLALVRMEVIEIQNGIPVLVNDWVSKIDHLVLEDMDGSWSSDTDPDGKFCINDEFRDTLEEHWEKSTMGWYFQHELVYSIADLDDWRESFEGQEEERANKTDGVGRFGL